MAGAVAVSVIVALGCEGAKDSPTAPGQVTLSLMGIVEEPGGPVSDARVAIVEGPLAGRATTTDQAGRFAFVIRDAPDESVWLEIAKQGYATSRRRAANGEHLVVMLVAVDIPRMDGNYTMTFTADQACEALPRHVVQRTYQARISRGAAMNVVTAELGGADFYAGYGNLLGVLGREFIRIHVSSLDAFNRWFDDFPIVERLGGESHLRLFGTALVPIASPGGASSGHFDGTIFYCDATIAPRAPGDMPGCSVSMATCRSAQHRLTLLRH